MELEPPALLSSTADSLTSIPVDILIPILCRLDHISLLRCSAACKYLRNVIEAVSYLRCVIALGADGSVEIPTSGRVSVVKRLQDLLDFRARWRTLDWKNRRSTRISTSQFSTMNDALITTSRYADQDIRSIAVTVLPTQDSAQRRIVINDFMVPQHSDFRTFFLDPARDLLVLAVEFRHYSLHFRSLRKTPMQAHPRCASPFVDIHNLFWRSYGRVQSMRAMGDLIGVHFRGEERDVVYLYNWVTGEQFPELHGGDDYLRFHDFDFVSASSFVIAVIPRRPSPQATTTPAGMIWVYDMVASGGTFRTSYKLALILHLPILSQDVHVLSMQCSPEHTTTLSDGRPSPTSHAVAFDLNLLALQMPLRSNRCRRAWLRLIVRRDVFSSLVKRFPEAGSPSSTPTLDWEDWGPDNTRLFAPEWTPRNPSGNIQSGRIVRTATDVLGSRYSEVLDFNAGRYKFHELVTSPTMVYEPLLFRDTIITHLPYHAVSIPDSECYNDFMVGEDRLVCFQPPAISDAVQVDIFEF
ncbi:hypothetical protein EVG20_g4335 [Dentipellis fragilis]|uniref:F-box domain-containing protein n=1 Tax=Dentipellis fragilis TaxID=205917 RepID=A0A4Y9YVX8_9AGAM|nr:hypothetical protein EVG20_g4335 [Dentipellis fragilis]